MKTYIRLIISVLAVLAFHACDQEYIDPVSRVDPGPDQSEPLVEITYPTGDVIIPFTDTETDLNLEIEVVDDIEIQSIKMTLNGSELTTFNQFKDYRRALESFHIESVPIGNYSLVVTATDLSGKSNTKTLQFEITNKYVPKYAGEIFYMPFEQLFMELISETNATVVGNPGFTNGKIGKAYDGAADSYLTFNTDFLNLGSNFSAVFWLNVNATPDRAGILVIGPVDEANPTAMNNRKNGFRFFREGSATNQTFKLNVGNGTADTWFDGGAAASLNPNTAGWAHFAFTISNTGCKVYINGQLVKEGDFTGVDWTGCDILSIMSGAPRFTEWGHLSDQSFMDELRLFNKALTQQEIQAIIDAES